MNTKTKLGPNKGRSGNYLGEFSLPSGRRFGLDPPTICRPWAIAGSIMAVMLAATCALGQTVYTPYTFTTLAGTQGQGSADGTGSAARFAIPIGLAVDAADNLYVADHMNYTVRKVTPEGVVTTLAGVAGCPDSIDGTNGVPRFGGPGDVAVDASGALYVAGNHEHTIRKITSVGTNWVVTTVAGTAQTPGSADGEGSAARFNSPCGVTVDSSGDLYAADSGNHTIRKVTPSGVVTTVAGAAGTPGSADGLGSVARFNFPSDLAADSAGNLYVADQANHTIRKMARSGTNWVVSTIAGSPGNPGSQDGMGGSARFNCPSGVALYTNGSLYVADRVNSTIRKVTLVGTSWVVSTIAGFAGALGTNDGTNAWARFYWPRGVATDSAGNVYAADTQNNTIRKITPVGANWVVNTFAGLAVGTMGSTDGSGSAARFYAPYGITIDTNRNLYIADNGNSTIRKVTPAGIVTTIAGLAGNPGSNNGTNGAARFYLPIGVAVDNSTSVFVADSGNHTIRKVTPAGTNWVITTIAGHAGLPGSNDGTNSAALLNGPAGVAVDNAGIVYVTDTGNQTIRKIAPVGTNWVVTTLAGLPHVAGSADGTNMYARFNYPIEVTVDSSGNLYVADSENHTIREITPFGTNWVVSTVAGLAGQQGTTDGTGNAARFSYPYGVEVDSDGNLYVAELNNLLLRRMMPAGTNWVVTTLGGDPTCSGGRDGTGGSASFVLPIGITVDNAKNIYVTELRGNTIRKGFPAGSVPAPVLQTPGLSAGKFGFGITGLPAVWVNVESSSDMTNWDVVGTRLLENGTNSFLGAGGIQGSEFYRCYVR